ncbi:MAG: hypothetical protein U9N33_04345 [Campylobacterota bacterium]|nr:hypothetical protein [Campylobacterota bacterium]
MLHNMCASVKMEEGYMRISIEYTDPSSRSMICDTIGEVEIELDMRPEVFHRRLEDSKGVFGVEFSGEDYVCQRSSGEFIELLLKKLNISICDNS